MSISRITPTLKQTPATWVALTAAYDSIEEKEPPPPANFKGMHAADMAGILARVGFQEADRKTTEVMRVLTMRAPNKKFIVTLVEVTAPQFFTSASIVMDEEE